MNDQSTTEQDASIISERGLLDKIKAALQFASQECIRNALILFYTLRAPATPLWCKTAILGSLGYFLSMIDGIPDMTPFLGYTDDAAVLAASVASLAAHITPEIREKAAAKMDYLFKKDKQA